MGVLLSPLLIWLVLPSQGGETQTHLVVNLPRLRVRLLEAQQKGLHGLALGLVIRVLPRGRGLGLFRRRIRLGGLVHLLRRRGRREGRRGTEIGGGQQKKFEKKLEKKTSFFSFFLVWGENGELNFSIFQFFALPSAAALLAAPLGS